MSAPAANAPKPPMSFQEKIRAMMERSGDSYRKCCQRMGGKGGRTAGRNKVRRRLEVEKQERMGLR